MSEKAKTLGEKITEVMLEVGYLTKDSVNAHYKYRYVSDEKVAGKVREALAKRGVWVEACSSELVSCDPVVVVRNTYTLTDGKDVVRWEGIGGGKDAGDKAPMKASTAARKYALINGLMMAAGNDPEADMLTDMTANIDAAKSQDELDKLKKEYGEVAKGFNGRDVAKLKKAFSKRESELA